MFSSTLRTSRMEIPPISGAPTFLVMASSSSAMSAVSSPSLALNSARVGRAPIQNSPERESA